VIFYIPDFKLKPEKGTPMKLPLAYYGNPILRKKGGRIEKIDEEVKTLVASMIETMQAYDGIGIAAPQVHHSLAIFVICRMKKNEKGNWDVGDEVQVFINPKIISYSPEVKESVEACLSIPKLEGKVIRPYKVVIEATDLEGNVFVKEFVDLEARIVLHENDHINGVLFIDRMDAKSKKLLEPKLRAIKKNFN